MKSIRKKTEAGNSKGEIMSIAGVTHHLNDSVKHIFHTLVCLDFATHI